MIYSKSIQILIDFQICVHFKLNSCAFSNCCCKYKCALHSFINYKFINNYVLMVHTF